jgi:ABC-2 type transport system ATP-binding protein/lipopolysaccharide transport system ATP-binding protein
VIAVGDEEFQRKCFDYLHGLRRAGTSMLIVSHGLGSITDLCDEAMWLERGVTREIGPSQSVTQSYLNEVNAREAARTVSVDPEPADPAIVVGRRGSGEIRFSSFEPVNAAGEVVAVLISGEAARLRIQYECHSPVSDAVFTLSVVNAQDVRVMSVASGRIPVQPGRGHLEFDTDQLLLLHGTYTVEVLVTAEGRTLDAVPAAWELSVRAAEVTSAGTYLQHGSWRHVEDSGEQRTVSG